MLPLHVQAYPEGNEKDCRAAATVYDTPEFLSQVESYRLGDHS